MVKKIKGIRVAKDLQSKFKFNSEGNSILGNDVASSHEIKGTMDATGSLNLEGDITLQERLSGFLFSPPHIDAAVETAMIQEFINNAASKYEGFMVYITNPAATAPFDLENKFYFCENGTWHASPFIGQITNYAPNLNPLYEISVAASGTDSVPFQLNLPADLFLDADGDYITYSATMVNGDPLPAWLYFDATNTILSGTPTESDVGLLNVLVTATDPSSESGSTTQEIQILAKPVPFWAGGTHEFNTYGDSSWATILPSNQLSLNPVQGGSNAWHKIIAPDEYNIFNRTVSIDFSFADWYNSSTAGSSDNKIAIGFQPQWGNTAAKYMEFYLSDDGGSKRLMPKLYTHDGVNNNDSGGNWEYDPYNTDPADIANMEDFDFRIEIGRAAKHYSWNAYYIPVLVLGKRRTHQDLVAAGIDNISFEDLRTSSEFQQLYYDLGNSYPTVYKHFYRSAYSVLISMVGDDDETDLFVKPYVRALQRFPYDTTTPVAIFDTFNISVDEGPVEDENLPFGDFTVEEGQPITITVPANLFVDPEGETPLLYGTRRTSYQAIPSWLSFDVNTGVYTGTPTTADVGTYEIAVWGMDDAAESAGQISNPQSSYARTFTVTVTSL